MQMKTNKFTDMLEKIKTCLPNNINDMRTMNFDKEIDNKNYRPYIYVNNDSCTLKVFRVYKKTLETVLAVYHYGDLQSEHVSNFSGTIYLDKERDGKAIKTLSPEHQKGLKGNMMGCVCFDNYDEFVEVLMDISEKLKWEF